MAYDKGRLNAKQIEALTKPGHYADGKGLYLQVSKWGTKSWVFKFTLGKRKNKRGELVPRVRIHNQNMTTAARAQADRNTFGHLS